MSNVRCTTYIVPPPLYTDCSTLYTVYTVHRIMYGVRYIYCASYVLHSTMYTVEWTTNDIDCASPDERCTLYFIKCTHYTVLHQMYDVYCTQIILSVLFISYVFLVALECYALSYIHTIILANVVCCLLYDILYSSYVIRLSITLYIVRCVKLYNACILYLFKVDLCRMFLL